MDAITLTKQEARTFLLYYQGLLGEFDHAGKEGILAYIRRVGCIQFDPLDVVGMNPELVLQSRISDFNRSMLGELLYHDRRLVDYWDKQMAIFPVEDWPHFERLRSRFQPWCSAHKEVVNKVYADIESRGHLCSGDLQYDEKVDWAWGPTRLARAALEGMYHAGSLVIHHKTKTRKYYDLAERLIPRHLHASPDPFQSDEQYYDWFVLRRIGSVGLLWNWPSDAWLGIAGMKSAQRNEAFARLAADNRILEVIVEGLQYPLYMRASDKSVLDDALTRETAGQRASFLAPLDNLLWDRVLIKALFDFEYRWEVYKPAAERKYGYYVLPVLCGDRLVARFEPEKHRKQAPFAIKNWWWEDQVDVDETMKVQMRNCLERFAAYLGADFQKDDFDFSAFRHT